MCLLHNSWVPAYYDRTAEFGSNPKIWSFNHNYSGVPVYRFGDGIECLSSSDCVGKDHAMWNDAATGRNYHYDYWFEVCANSNYGEPCYAIPPRGTRNLPDGGPSEAVKNENTSMQWLYGS